MTEDSQVLTLLLIENGAPWPAWSADLRARAPNMVLEAQMEAESMEAFGQRVMQRIERLVERHDRVLGAAYLCGLGDSSRDTVRQRICRALIGALDKATDAELIVGGAVREQGVAADRERARLLALWTALSEQSANHPVSIRLDDGAHDGSTAHFSGSSEPRPFD